MILFAAIISDPCDTSEPWCYVSDWCSGRQLISDLTKHLKLVGLSWWDTLNIIERVKASINNACRSEYEEVVWMGYHIEIHEREVVHDSRV